MKYKILFSVVLYFILAFTTNINGNCLAKFNVVIHASDTSCEFKNISTPNATFYYWNFGDGTYTIQTEKIDIIHKYKLLGKYKVTLITEDTSTANYCTEVFTQEVNFDSDLGVCNALFNYSAPGGNQLNYSFVNNSTGSYNKAYWSFGDGSFSNKIGNINHNYSKPGRYKVKLIIYDTITGCKSIETKRIDVGNDNFYADFNYFSMDTVGSRFKFLNKSSNPFTCYWEFGDGNVSRKTNPIHEYIVPGRYTVKLTVKHKLTGEIAGYSDDIIVKSNENKCNANFNSVVDIENEKVFLLNESKCSQKTRFTWNFGDENLAFKKNVVHEYSKKGIYTVCLTLYDTISGCNSFYSDEIFICDSVVKANKFDYFIDSVNNVSFASNSLNAENVKWFFGDNINASDSSIEHAYIQKDLYFVHLQEHFDEFTYHQSQLINVNSDDTSLSCAFGTIVNDNFIEAAPPTGYTGAIRGQVSKLIWTFGDNTSDSTTINPVHQYADTGNYNVCLTVQNQYTKQIYTCCKNVNVSYNSSVNSVSDNNFQANIYPNPVANELNISLASIVNNNIKMKIFNSLGFVLIQKENYVSIGENNIKIDVSKLNKGLYFLELHDGKSYFTYKFVVNK